MEPSMTIEYDELQYLSNPQQQDLSADYQQFLLSLFVPTVIDITGKNTNKWGVICTLIHGNEPSGIIAIHRWLTEQGELPQPEINIRIIIASVEAACATPLFTHRSLPGEKDLDRCFGQKQNHSIYKRANVIEHAIEEVNPAFIVDLHNTSGASPAFASSPVITPETLTIASFFSSTLILSDLNFGALVNLKFNCPVLAIECGNCNDEQAHDTAFQGIKALAKYENIKQVPQFRPVSVLYKPLCLQLKPSVSLSFNEFNEGFIGVTLKKNIEQFNFGKAQEGQLIGWVDSNGLDNLELINEANENVIDDYFILRDEQLICKTPMRIFLATTSRDIATTVCLFYVIKAHCHEC